MRSFAWSLVVMLGWVVTGCGGSGSYTPPPTPPPTPPAASLAVTAPQDGASVNGQPVTISISANHIADRSQLSVLLDGSDITSRLSAPDTNGVQSVQVSQPDVNFGKNQVQVRYQNSRANSTFTLNTASGGGGVGSGVSIGSELVAVTTRVLMPGTTGTSATNWGIQVGDGPPSWSGVPKNQNGDPCGNCSFGYQILLLSRQDLSVISNISYEVANYQEIAPTSAFVEALSSLGQGNYDTPSIPNKQPAPTQCVPIGCIVVMQSLAQIGYNPCYNGSDPKYLGVCPPFVEDPTNAGTLIYWLTKLGASGQNLFANGMANPHVGYSFIGIAGSGKMPGQGSIGGTDSQGGIIVANQPTTNGQFERMSCSDSRSGNPVTVCDNLYRAGSADSTDGNTDIQQAGRISGVFIRDNYNLFTFSQNAPQLTYTFETTLSGGTYTNVVSINGSTTEGGGQYTMSMPSTSTGGFRLLVLQANHPDWADVKRWDKFYNCCKDNSNDLTALEQDISSFPDENNLFFLAAMGDIQHSIAEDDPAFAPQWETLVQTLRVLGAEPMTVRILGDRHPAFDHDGEDDYLLVGKTIPSSPPFVENFTAGMPSRYTAQEGGYVINRHTLANATSPSQMEGILVMDHHGYYTPHMQANAQGLMVPQVASLAGASLLAPVAWPLTSDVKDQNAYTWISGQLCCADIRATYINLNASPAVWLTQLDQLTYPSDQSGSFAEADFDDVKQQLATEFSYVAAARNLQSNILSLYQSQQSNVGLILDQAASDIKADVDTDSPPPTTPTPWSAFTSDVFPMLSNLAGFLPEGGNVAKTALGIGTLVIDNATDHSNDGSGVSQTMHALANEEVAEANLAQYAADQYADSLGTLGNDFKRIVTDWGRLKAVGGPIDSGQLIWDPVASSMFLRAFDLTTRRQYYPLLMRNNPNFFITHIRYGDVQYYGRDSKLHWGHNQDNHCFQSKFAEAQDNLQSPGYANDGEDLRGTAWWPGYLQSSQGTSDDPHHPPAYWWDVWALGLGPETNDHCPEPESGGGALPNTFGMFDAISSADATETSGLGLWKPYVLQYGNWANIYVDYNSNYEGYAP